MWVTILTKPLVRRAAVGLVVFIALWAYGALKDGQGYKRAETVYQLKIEKLKSDQALQALAETERQQAANESAKRREAELLADLKQQNNDLDQLLLEQSVEALQDSNANGGGINASSVRRLNQIK